MSDIFSSLGLSTRITVGISITTNNKIELASIDKNSHSIVKYASRDLKYNNAIKEIVDEQELILVVQELFKETGLQPNNCNVIFNLPNVHFAFASVPLVVPDEQVATTLLSDVEQLYLFKRHDPVISWNNVEKNNSSDQRAVVYGAIQDKTVATIVQTCQTVGCKLEAIETSYAGMVRGVIYSGILDNEINATESTNILFITSNNFAIFSLYGSKLIEYYEEPLAIKSFTNDEVYLAISSAAGSALSNYPTKNLLIVSETDEVSAELLAEKIRYDGTIKYLDRNKFTNKSFMNISYSILQNYMPYITLESVGAAAYYYENDSFRFNFVSPSEVGGNILTINIGGKDVELNQAAIRIIFVSLIMVMILAVFIIKITVDSSNKKIKSQVDALNAEKEELILKIKESNMTLEAADIYTISQRIYKENKKQIELFNGLASEIPKEVWVEKYKTTSRGEVTISGKSTGSQQIYTFFKGLKRNSPDIYISQLQLDFDESSPIPNLNSNNNIFTYEIISSKNAALMPVPEAGAGGLPPGTIPENPTGDVPPPISTAPQ